MLSHWPHVATHVATQVAAHVASVKALLMMLFVAVSAWSAESFEMPFEAEIVWVP